MEEMRAVGRAGNLPSRFHHWFPVYLYDVYAYRSPLCLRVRACVRACVHRQTWSMDAMRAGRSRRANMIRSTEEESIGLRSSIINLPTACGSMLALLLRNIEANART